jgi:hypothetical protein
VDGYTIFVCATRISGKVFLERSILPRKPAARYDVQWRVTVTPTSTSPSSTPDKIALREELSQSNRGTQARGSHTNLFCAPSLAACLIIDYLMVPFQMQTLFGVKRNVKTIMNGKEDRTQKFLWSALRYHIDSTLQSHFASKSCSPICFTVLYMYIHYPCLNYSCP